MSNQFLVYKDSEINKWIVLPTNNDSEPPTGNVECLAGKCLHCNTIKAALSLAKMMNEQEANA